MTLDVSDPALQAAWDEVTSKDAELNWVLFTLNYDSRPTKLELVGSGTGGLDEYKTHLNEDGVFFGCLRVVGVDDRGCTVSRRDKFVFVTYIGNSLSVLKKARVSTQKAQASEIFNVGCNMQFDEISEITPQEIALKLIASGGAHKPGYYEFGPGQKVDANFYESEMEYANIKTG